MEKVYKTAIIGGGAAGLFAALLLTTGENAFSGEDVVILERNDRVGKKLLVTGNGQGNLTNKNISVDNYYGDKAFIKTFFGAINEFSLTDTLENFGVPISFDKTGRGYPVSRQANATVDAFRAILTKKNVKIITDAFVYDVKKEEAGFTVIYRNAKAESGESNDFKTKVYAENVICAFGGKSGENFGTDGSSYKILEKLGHKTTALYPSLVQLKTETEKIKSLKGLKEDVVINAYDGKTFIKSAKGEILFTEYGVSGPAAFQVSGHLAECRNPDITIEFLPEYTLSETVGLIKKRMESGAFSDENDVLNGLLKKRTGQVVASGVKVKTPENLAFAIKNFKLKVTGNTGFNNSQVTKGGISTDKINPITMESKTCRGVYTAGELLNVDGDCGGYNLTFAFSGAYSAVRAIKNKS